MSDCLRASMCYTSVQSVAVCCEYFCNANANILHIQGWEPWLNVLSLYVILTGSCDRQSFP